MKLTLNYTKKLFKRGTSSRKDKASNESNIETEKTGEITP